MPKNANFIKFYNLMIKSHEDLQICWKLLKEYIKAQYRLLKTGVRSIEVSNAACSAWMIAGGKW